MIELIIVGSIIIYILIIGKGKDKLWALAPIGIYLVVSLCDTIVAGIIFGFNNIKEMNKAPQYFIFAIVNAVIIIGSSFLIVRHAQKKKLDRIMKEIGQPEEMNIQK